ncbi:hypothetical protein U1Q18_003541, partial [Sarracenia purpurea var. burkii]
RLEIRSFMVSGLRASESELRSRPLQRMHKQTLLQDRISKLLRLHGDEMGFNGASNVADYCFGVSAISPKLPYLVCESDVSGSMGFLKLISLDDLVDLCWLISLVVP